MCLTSFCNVGHRRAVDRQPHTFVLLQLMYRPLCLLDSLRAATVRLVSTQQVTVVTPDSVHPEACVFSQVKAERHVDGEATIEDLQHRTVKHIKEEHHEEEVIQDPSKAGKKAQ